MKAIIMSHYPERSANLPIMISDLMKNGLQRHEIIVMVDYETETLPIPGIISSIPQPINWWHGMAAIQDTDYVMLLCDDLTLRRNSVRELKRYADTHPEYDVFGYEGGNFHDSDKPYSGGNPSHRTVKIEKADYIIRFYMGRPKAFIKALELYHSLGTKKVSRIHDDLLLSLSNQPAIIPTLVDSGWDELPVYGKGYCYDPNHYSERDSLINLFKL